METRVMVHIKYYQPTLADFEIDENEGSRYLISGYPGTGKTTLGKLLLRSQGAHDICEITSIHLYQGKLISDRLTKHRRTLNVLGLLQGVVKLKGVLFEDIDVFHAGDKKSFDIICTAYEDSTDTRIMAITCPTQFLKNRRLQKWSGRGQIWAPTLTQTPTQTLRLQTCLQDILRLNGIQVSPARIQALQDLRNFHRIYEAIQRLTEDCGEDYREAVMAPDVRDDTYPTDEVIESLLHQEELSVSEMLRASGSDARVIGLTLVDALPIYMEPDYSCAKHLSSLYRDQVAGDISETWMTSHHHWEILEFVDLLKTYRPIQYIRETLHKPSIVFPYPTYLSRGISIAHNRSLLRRLHSSPEDLLSAIALLYQSRLSVGPMSPMSPMSQGPLMDRLRMIAVKEVRLLCQGVQAIYGYKLTAKALLKIIA